MILSDVTILKYLQTGMIRIHPEVQPSDVRPAGIRLHLAGELLVPTGPCTIDLGTPAVAPFELISIAVGGYTLSPGGFVLASTREQIQAVAPLVGVLDGRSTLARLGLLVHAGSVIIDGNHDEARSIVLELKNVGPYELVLRPGLPIAMVAFVALSAPIAQPSCQQYRSQCGVAAPNLPDETLPKRP